MTTNQGKDQSMKIIGIDLSALFRRHYEAKEGDPGAARARSVEEVQRIREGFDRVAVCLDGGRSFRAAIEPSYKAHRVRPPEAYYEQRRRCVERLRADGCAIFAAPEVDLSAAGGPAAGLYAEADDVLAALAAWAREGGHELTIYSGDKDLLQLVGEGVDVWRHDSPPPLLDEQSEPERTWRPAHVLRFHKAAEDRKVVLIGVDPPRVADVLALAGDSSDGFSPFPGWVEDGKKKPGIGMTTAIRLVQRFGTVTNVIAALDMRDENDDPVIRGHIHEVLRRGQPTPIKAALRGLDLATLRIVDVDFAPLLTDAPAPAPVAGASMEAEPGDSFSPDPEPAPGPALVVNGREAVPGPEAHEWVEREPTAPKPPPAPLAVRREPGPTPEPRSTALTVAPAAPMVVEGINRYAFQPRDLGELWRTSKALCNSRLYPQYGTPEAIMAIAIEAGERGVPIGLALRNGYVVKGRPAWSASFLAALVLSSGKARAFRIVETDEQHATLEYQRIGEPVPSRFTFTIEEARKAGWLKSGQNGDSKWITNPRTMLRWAALREGARAFFPDVVAGMHTPDELRSGHVTDEEIDAPEVAS